MQRKPRPVLESRDLSSSPRSLCDRPSSAGGVRRLERRRDDGRAWRDRLRTGRGQRRGRCRCTCDSLLRDPGKDDDRRRRAGRRRASGRRRQPRRSPKRDVRRAEERRLRARGAARKHVCDDGRSSADSPAERRLQHPDRTSLEPAGCHRLRRYSRRGAGHRGRILIPVSTPAAADPRRRAEVALTAVPGAVPFNEAARNRAWVAE